MHERRRREAGVPRTARLAVGGPAGETTDFGADHKFSPLERMLLTAAVCTEMPAPPTGRALLLGGGSDPPSSRALLRGHGLRCAGGVPSSVRPLLRSRRFQAKIHVGRRRPPPPTKNPAHKCFVVIAKCVYATHTHRDPPCVCRLHGVHSVCGGRQRDFHPRSIRYLEPVTYHLTTRGQSSKEFFTFLTRVRVVVQCVALGAGSANLDIAFARGPRSAR